MAVHSGKSTGAIALIAVLAVFTIGACGGSISSTSPDSPAQQVEAASPAPSPNLTRERAVAIATEAFKQDHTLATAVEDPHDMATRLMRLRELRGAASLPAFGTYGDTLVWIAQVEGTSKAVQSIPDVTKEARLYRFNALAIDALTGDLISRLQSEYEPFILPLELLPQGLVNAGLDERDIQRDALPIKRDEAVQLVFAKHGEPLLQNMEAIETALVHYSNPLLPGDSSIGPTPTPTRGSFPPATPTAGPPLPPKAVSTPRVRETSTPVVERLSWLVMNPGELSFSSCFISGPPGESHLTCWMTVPYFFVDAETGEIYDAEAQAFLGPSLTNEESSALQRFARAEGWWALWHVLREYNRQRIPEGLAAQLDRPDAPAPTP